MKKPAKDPIKDPETPSSNDYSDYPEDSFDLVNKFGTYEIQPTADTSNIFPTVAQGLQKAAPKHKNGKPSKKVLKESDK